MQGINIIGVINPITVNLYHQEIQPNVIYAQKIVSNVDTIEFYVMNVTIKSRDILKVQII